VNPENVGEFLSFQQMPDIPGRKTHIWQVRARRSGDLLGRIAWNAPWRQYIFDAQPMTVYSAGCLRDIATFIDRQKGK